MAGAASLAAEPAVAVVYPEVRQPYQRIFEDIASGLEDGLGRSVHRYVLPKDAGDGRLARWLKDEGIELVVALGRRAQTSLAGMAGAPPVIVGAVSMSAEMADSGQTGIVLNPDPHLLLGRLRELVPEVRRVTLVYNPRHSAWLAGRARAVAVELGIDLETRPADNLRTAARAYRDYLRGNTGAEHALWLLADASILDSRALLPLIIKESWDRRLVVFSTNPGLVKRGALFALYPDNLGMGRSLAALVRRHQAAGAGGAGVLQPLRDLLIAVNTRTAAHLGLKFTVQQRRGFDLSFPVQ